MKLFLTRLSIITLLFFVAGCVDLLFDTARHSQRGVKASAWLGPAMRGDVNAMYNLGEALCCGNRPLYNNVEALQWWCRAAKQGQINAMLEVGKMYAHEYDVKGDIIPRDEILALTYYRVAEEHGNEEAAFYREDLETKMNEEQFAKSRALVGIWPRVACEVARNPVITLPDFKMPDFKEQE